MAKSGMKPVYIGDVGDTTRLVQPKKSLPEGIDFSKLTFRQMCNIAVAVGFDVRDIIGVSSCDKHYGMIEFPYTHEFPEGMNLFDHCTYCKNCWKLFRKKHV